uniref:Uncharacterized protein n=1 Tax=Arundo donax TaxID=35708 RepID=A0A0A8ZW19_ARUDO
MYVWIATYLFHSDAKFCSESILLILHAKFAKMCSGRWLIVYVGNDHEPYAIAIDT